MNIFGKRNKAEQAKDIPAPGTPCEKCGSTNTRIFEFRTTIYGGGILGTPANVVRVLVCRDCNHRAVKIFV